MQFLNGSAEDKLINIYFKVSLSFNLSRRITLRSLNTDRVLVV